jgi:shikimate kinase
LISFFSKFKSRGRSKAHGFFFGQRWPDAEEEWRTRQKSVSSPSANKRRAGVGVGPFEFTSNGGGGEALPRRAESRFLILARFSRMNIVLIGYRCSGKTTVGRLLAERTRKGFRDTDIVVEETTGISVENLVSTEGWNTFRALEKQAVQAVSAQDNQVIAVGGGAVLDEENVRNLIKGALVVWLDGTPEVLRGRMEREQRLGKIRPSLTDEDPLTEIRQVLKTRRPVYEKVSALRVDTSALGPAETATVIIEALQEKKGKRLHGR